MKIFFKSASIGLIFIKTAFPHPELGTTEYFSRPSFLENIDLYLSLFPRGKIAHASRHTCRLTHTNPLYCP